MGCFCSSPKTPLHDISSDSENDDQDEEFLVETEAGETTFMAKERTRTKRSSLEALRMNVNVKSRMKAFSHVPDKKPTKRPKKTKKTRKWELEKRQRQNENHKLSAAAFLAPTNNAPMDGGVDYKTRKKKYTVGIDKIDDRAKGREKKIKASRVGELEAIDVNRELVAEKIELVLENISTRAVEDKEKFKLHQELHKVSHEELIKTDRIDETSKILEEYLVDRDLLNEDRTQLKAINNPVFESLANNMAEMEHIAKLCAKTIENAKDTLRTIHLNNCALSNKFIEITAPALRLCPNLEEIQLESNDIKETGFDALAALITESTSLKIFKIANQRSVISTAACERFCDAIDQNTSLVKVSIDFRQLNFRNRVDKRIKLNGDSARKQRLIEKHHQRQRRHSPKTTSI